MQIFSQKSLPLIFGITLVLFLLLDGGALGESLVSRGAAKHFASWLWVAPTLLIFGMGFVLAWLIFGTGERPSSRASAEHEGIDGLSYSSSGDKLTPSRR